ncbi:MAG TPA: hypothetical protein VJQ06_04120 [Rhizomicrobium sp.]|nr:hypothetical protein [Rhizomicrobium sp.]
MKRLNGMKHVNRLAALALMLLSASCAQVTLVEAGKPVVVGNGLTVMPQRQWNQIKTDHILWTADGPGVNQVNFYTGIKTGKPLFEIVGVKDQAIGAFDAKMLPNDIQDLVVASMGKQGYQNVRPGNLTPCPFGKLTGFCFDLTFATPDGLEMKGMTMARKQLDTLDLFLFQAPGEYYYGELAPTVGKVFASAQTN